MNAKPKGEKPSKKASKLRVVFNGMADGSDFNSPANQDKIARALIRLVAIHQEAAHAAD